MIAAPSNAAVDTLLEIQAVRRGRKSAVVRPGRVGGDTHGKDRTDRFYLQRYELDGMVDRRIEAYRQNKETRMKSESDGFLRKQYEQEILMNARVVGASQLFHG